MDDVTQRAQYLYNTYRFGNFIYGDKRINTEPLLLKFLSMVKNSSLYDIGCGEGFWTGAYLKTGIAKEQIHLLDLAPANIEYLKSKGFLAACGNILELPFEDDVADFTVCNGVIHHTANPYKAFRELVRITKPGGYIYLNVYNVWNPYFFIVHKMTFPIRYCYWNWNKKIAAVFYVFSKILFQPLAYLVFGAFLDGKTGKAMFYDQVITPRAFLFSKSKIKKYVDEHNCSVEQIAYNKCYLMIAAIIKVGKDSDKSKMK